MCNDFAESSLGVGGFGGVLFCWFGFFLWGISAIYSLDIFLSIGNTNALLVFTSNTVSVKNIQ